MTGRVIGERQRRKIRKDRPIEEMRTRVAPESVKRLLHVPRRLAVLLLRAYKVLLSPLLPPSCRFQPTCSEYCREAVMRYGLFRGGWLGLRRLLRCHPFSRGGHDPVPESRRVAE